MEDLFKILWAGLQELIEYVLWNCRLSRVFGVSLALLAIVTFVYGCFAPNSFWIGTLLGFTFGMAAYGFFKLGNWWEAREERRKAGQDVSLLPKRRGFEPVVTDHRKQRSR